MTVGILALQGDFREHEEVFQRLGVPARQVRLPSDLDQVERLIIPGGESTTISKLLARYQLIEPIRERAGKSLALWGTCAGAIVLSRAIAEGGAGDQVPLSLMDMVVRRNAYGRQIDSFEAELDVSALGERPFPGVFIRAPTIDSVGHEVEVLARLPGEPASIVAARQGRLLVATFHPELTSDYRFHNYFLEL